MRTRVIAEQEYEERMNGEVAAFLKKSLHHVKLRGEDGMRIHAVYALHPEAKASVILVHGLSEFIERYMEMIYYFYQEGYSVFMADNRGHGRSGRQVPEEDHIFVKDFSEYTSDLGFVIRELVKKKEPALPVLLYAHSMGGAISALYLEEHPEEIRAAVLSSPMLEINFGETPIWQVRTLAGASRLLFWYNRSMGKEGFDENPSFKESAGTSEARFLRQLRLRRAHAAYRTENVTFAWARAALKATDRLMAQAGQADLPILICQAGRDTLVSNEAEERFAASAPNAKIAYFPEAKHEIFNSEEEILAPYCETVLSFFEEQLKDGQRQEETVYQ